MNPLDTECKAVLGMIEKFSALTLKDGKRPEWLGEQIRETYAKLRKIPAREFTPHLWDKMTKRYQEVF
tara:strand:- start:540 stop:743 length:204 start_codon:yes stop_codon:yes gene_type:complete